MADQLKTIGQRWRPIERQRYNFCLRPLSLPLCLFASLLLCACVGLCFSCPRNKTLSSSFQLSPPLWSSDCFSLFFSLLSLSVCPSLFLSISLSFSLFLSLSLYLAFSVLLCLNLVLTPLFPLLPSSLFFPVLPPSISTQLAFSRQILL